MFTGIIETLGEITKISNEGTNYHFFIKSNFTKELKIDQSVAHNGVCLTIVDIADDTYKVTAIDETLQKTNLKDWKVGEKINLERGLKLGDRLDGHIVQGHVDQTAICQEKIDHNGSILFTFSYDPKTGNSTIEKGSITINGVSLTVVNSEKGRFSVAIIPYTLAHTNLNTIEVNSIVNLEFDVIGKYVLSKMK